MGESIWLEIDCIMNATEAFGVTTSIVKAALEEIGFWNNNIENETIEEEVLQKIEPFIILSKQISEKADIIENGIAFIVEDKSLVVLDLYNHRSRAEIEMKNDEEFKVLSNSFEDAERKEDVLQYLERNRLHILKIVEERSNKIVN